LLDEFGTPSRPTFVRLAELPRTSKGEVALDELVRLADAVERPAPGTDSEKRLAEIWRRLLAVPSISLADNFFDLGGDSLVAARVVAEIREQFGVDVTLRQLFDAATLGDLAQTVDAGETSRLVTPGQASPPSLAMADTGELLERLDDMGDDEVDRLLRELDERRVVGG
jgi:acyl carrier protein